MFSRIVASRRNATRAGRRTALLGFAILLALAVLPAAQALAQNTFQGDCVPPLTSVYVGQFHARYNDGSNVYDLTQPQHKKFTNCSPPPDAGNPDTDHSFGSNVTGVIQVNGGPPFGFDGPAITRVLMHNKGSNGATRFFDTEMIQLDLSGGNLPPGVMVRESPTKQSLGKTAITDQGGGTFRIDSFFDVFTELSVDGGQTWHPSTDTSGNSKAGHMTIPGTVAVNSSTWGNLKNLYKNP